MQTESVQKNSIAYSSLQIFIRVVQIFLQIRIFATEYNDFIFYQILGTSIPWMFILSLLLYFPNKKVLKRIITKEDYFEILQIDFLHRYPSSNRNDPKLFYSLKTFMLVGLNLYSRAKLYEYIIFSNASILLQLVDVIDMTLLSHNHLFLIHQKLNIKFDLMQIINECIIWNLFNYSNGIPKCLEDSTYIQLLQLGAPLFVIALEWRKICKREDMGFKNKYLTFFLSLLVAVYILVNSFYLLYFVPPSFFIYFEKLTTKQKQNKEVSESNNTQHVYFLIFSVTFYICLWYQREEFADVEIGYEMIIAQFIIGGKFMLDIMKWLINFIRYSSHYPKFKLTQEFLTNYNPTHPDFQIFINRPYLMKSEVKIISPIQKETDQNIRSILSTILGLNGLIEISVNSEQKPKNKDEFFEILDINPYEKKIYLKVEKDFKFGLVVLTQLNQRKFYDYNIKVKVKDNLIEIMSTALALNYELLPKLELFKYHYNTTEVENKPFLLIKSTTCSLSLFYSQMSEFMRFDSRLICLDLYYN